MHEILKKLDGGDLRSIGRAEEVCREVLGNPELFSIVFNGILSEKPVIRMRAADAIEKVSSKHPEYLQPFKETLIKKISKIQQKEVRWHVAQMFSYLRLEAPETDRVVEILLEYLRDESRIVQTCALQALADVAARDERHRLPIISIIEKATLTGPPAVKARGRRLLKKL
jgi:HEAT repeat protein